VSLVLVVYTIGLLLILSLALGFPCEVTGDLLKRLFSDCRQMTGISTFFATRQCWRPRGSQSALAMAGALFLLCQHLFAQRFERQ